MGNVGGTQPSPGQGVATFDFHNTLVECDAWFQLEIRHLASAAMERIAADCGNGIVDFDAEVLDRQYAKLRKSIHRHGHELDAVQSVRHVLSRKHISVDDEHLETAIDELMRDALEDASPVPGAKETLQQLAASGIPIGVVSSAVHHPFLEWSLDRFGMGALIKTITTSASAGYYKSRPEIFWTTLESLGARPSRSVHVGDSLRFDVGGSQAAGMKAVWFSRRANNVRNDGHIPDRTVESMVGAGDIVAELLAETEGSRQA